MTKALPGLWRFQAAHPEWTEEDGGEEGWDPIVAWWAVSTARGLLLIDPLVTDWDELDGLVAGNGGCAGVVRTIHWHERSVADAAERFGAPVFAGPPASGARSVPPDRVLSDGQEVADGIRAFLVERADEIALWLPAQSALLFADAMLRNDSGQLRVCPDSWTQPEGGPERLRALLCHLAELPAEHVLVSHGPLVLGDGREALREAL